MIEMLNMTMHENYDDIPRHGLLGHDEYYGENDNAWKL